MEQPPLDNNSNEPQPLQTEPTPPPRPALWSANDSWLGLGLLLVLVAAYFLFIAHFGSFKKTGTIVVATFEFILLIPIAVILLWRRVPLVELGLRKFSSNNIALGCGLLLAVYVVTIINNLIMVMLRISTQADVVSELLGEIDSPLLFALVTAIVAPFTEELFFRGFLFKGLREKYGWGNALMFSSIIFALFHGQVATLLPTFMLGALFAYMYQRTESVFPGMILHFTVNAFGAAVLLLANQMGVL